MITITYVPPVSVLANVYLMHQLFYWSSYPGPNLLLDAAFVWFSILLNLGKCCPDAGKCCPDAGKCCPDAGMHCPDVSFESSILFNPGSVAPMSMTFLFFEEND